jgi:four helix bundle protein
MMHKDLEVYKASMELVGMVYELCKDFPKEEIYGLTSQMKRAAVSVPSNIAEGNGRKSPKELNNFLNIALGSLIELETQLDIAKMLRFSMDEMHHQAIEDQLQKAKRLLIGLIKSVQAKL